MIVECVVNPVASDTEPPGASPWITVGANYRVAALLAVPNSRIELQIIADDGFSLAWFDSSLFLTVDSSIPKSWTVRVNDAGAVEFAPAAWLVDGFWESYYDGDAIAARAVESELEKLLRP